MARFNSPHEFSEIHSAGFYGSSSPRETPPVRRNLNSFISTSPDIWLSLIQSKKEKIILSFSNNERQIFLYKLDKNSLFKFPERSSKSSDIGASAIAYVNNRVKKGSEYWYIGSMRHIS